MVDREERSGAGAEREGTWVDEVMVISGPAVGDLDLRIDMPVVDRTGTPIGRVARIEERGPGGHPEAYVTPSEHVYARMGEERGGNTLGCPADRVEVDPAGKVRVGFTIGELFEMNAERGGRPRDVDVATQLGVEPRD